jgi:LDH2 family malate/lactate/ureidoglycolate dehydrogenase
MSRSVPEGWLIDSADSQPLPAALIADPPGLSCAGASAFKGYGLSIVVELLGGALSGEGCAAGSRSCTATASCLPFTH